MIKTIILTIICYEILRLALFSGIKFYLKRKRERENLQRFYEGVSSPAMRELMEEPWIYEMQREFLAAGVKEKNQKPEK